MIHEATAKSGFHAAGRARIAVAAVLSALLALAMLFVPVAGNGGKAHAADGGYSYGITLYAGNGIIAGAPSGADAITVDGLQYGSRISLVLNNGNDEGTATISVGGSQYTVIPSDDRYYPKGIRLAGDNEANMAKPEIEVTQNEQYVVAYGLKQERVTYRVDYVDASGKALADSQFFYGNVGDKPVAAFQYIEGYMPNAYNMTGTLDADESKNVFTFVYAPVAGAGREVIYVNRGFALGTGPAVAMQAASEGGAGADGAAAADATAQEPVELIDLDDDETPLASGALGSADAAADSNRGPAAMTMAVVASLVGLAALVVILAAMLRRAMRREDRRS